MQLRFMYPSDTSDKAINVWGLVSFKWTHAGQRFMRTRMSPGSPLSPNSPRGLRYSKVPYNTSNCYCDGSASRAMGFSMPEGESPPMKFAHPLPSRT